MKSSGDPDKSGHPGVNGAPPTGAKWGEDLVRSEFRAGGGFIGGQDYA
ncbi:MAG TPA: hypothetical protein VFO27_13255 [Bryobacteraceae bacterium]|nr:hypothetical protein [Bryobacteraceae bacterium]